MIKYLILLCFGFLFAANNLFAAQEDEYTIHPPTLTVPSRDDGTVIRSVAQFKAWTLLCDQDTKNKSILCNVTQAVSKKNAPNIFAWTLAATDDGEAFLIVKTSADFNQKFPILLTFKDLAQPVGIKISSCDEKACMGQTIIGNILKKEIQNASDVIVSYKTLKSGDISFKTTFAGLKQAIESLQ